MPLYVLETGVMLPPLIILKSQSQVSENLLKNFEAQPLIYSNQNRWITEPIYLDWINGIWLKLKVLDNKKLFLVMERCTLHTKESIKKPAETPSF